MVIMCVFLMCLIEGPLYVASFFVVVALAVFRSLSNAPEPDTPAAVALVVLLIGLLRQWRSRCRVPRVLSNGVFMGRVLSHVPSLHRRLVPPIWCWNGNLQLVPFLIRCALTKRVVYDDRQKIECEDGGHFYLHWLEPPRAMAARKLTREDLKLDSTPTVMFLHGLM